jgi:outer membrane immunogenic protein
MVRKFLGGLGLFTAVVAGAGAAGAADLAVKAPAFNAPPVILSDWAGFYIGVNGGYGWDSSVISRVNDNNQSLGTFPVSPKGGLVGGHVGYNWQFGSVIGGVELDFDSADIKATGVDITSFHGAAVTPKTDELGSARGRLGYAVLPSLLAYGTAGAGFGHTTIATAGAPTVATSQFGWVAGAGLEYKIWGNFIARAEYLHYDFGESSTTHGYNWVEKVDTVRGGLSYKF